MTYLSQLAVCPAEHYQPPGLGLGLLGVDEAGADDVVRGVVLAQLAGHDAAGVLLLHEGVAVHHLERVLVHYQHREHLYIMNNVNNKSV